MKPWENVTRNYYQQVHAAPFASYVELMAGIIYQPIIWVMTSGANEILSICKFHKHKTKHSNFTSWLISLLKTNIAKCSLEQKVVSYTSSVHRKTTRGEYFTHMCTFSL